MDHTRSRLALIVEDLVCAERKRVFYDRISRKQPIRVGNVDWERIKTIGKGGNDARDLQLHHALQVVNGETRVQQITEHHIHAAHEALDVVVAPSGGARWRNHKAIEEVAVSLIRKRDAEIFEMHEALAIVEGHIDRPPVQVLPKACFCIRLLELDVLTPAIKRHAATHDVEVRKRGIPLMLSDRCVGNYGKLVDAIGYMIDKGCKEGRNLVRCHRWEGLRCHQKIVETRVHVCNWGMWNGGGD